MCEEITLQTVTDTYNFRIGMPVEMVWPSDALQPRRATRWERIRGRVAQRLRSMTRWFRPRTVCSAIDRDAGSITMAEERWSWRHWRWERP
jgi:hypothetical protein